MAEEAKRVWVAGTYRGVLTAKGAKTTAWELIGVFDTEARAKEACKDEDDFYGPIPMNVEEHDRVPWEGVVYPLVGGGMVGVPV